MSACAFDLQDLYLVDNFDDERLVEVIEMVSATPRQHLGEAVTHAVLANGIMSPWASVSNTTTLLMISGELNT